MYFEKQIFPKSRKKLSIAGNDLSAGKHKMFKNNFCDEWLLRKSKADRLNAG